MHFCFYFCSDEILNLANFLKIKSHWNFIYISEINIKIIPSPHSQNSVLEIKGIYMLSFLKFFYNYSQETIYIYIYIYTHTNISLFKITGLYTSEVK